MFLFKVFNLFFSLLLERVDFFLERSIFCIIFLLVKCWRKCSNFHLRQNTFIILKAVDYFYPQAGVVVFI